MATMKSFCRKGSQERPQLPGGGRSPTTSPLPTTGATSNTRRRQKVGTEATEANVRCRQPEHQGEFETHPPIPPVKKTTGESMDPHVADNSRRGDQLRHHQDRRRRSYDTCETGSTARTRQPKKTDTQTKLHGIRGAETPLAHCRQVVSIAEGEERGGTDDAFNKVSGA
jgi:hypothetical protein